MAASNRRLAGELAFYAAHRDVWLREHRAYYVVVKNELVLGFFPTFETAYRAGAMAWGVDNDFLVKQIVDDEPTVSVFPATMWISS
jgi:hypothetical protein